jgi:hypothetical protein
MAAPSRREAIALILAAAPAAALAQAAGNPVRIRGAITGFDGQALAVTTRDGARVTVNLTPDATIVALRRLTLAELVPGANIGVVAEPGADGGLRATAITVLPPGARINQYQSAWDSAPNASMNNGVVEATVQSGSGHDLTLSIQGRPVRIRVPAEAPLLMPIPAARSDLVPGATVFMSAMRGEDGRLTASRVTVSKNGVAPAI